MTEKDKKLDHLLKNQIADKPATDFTNDVMHMISASSMNERHLASEIDTPIEQAPKHMTNLVMESINTPRRKAYQLLSFNEIRNLLIASLVVILGAAYIFIQVPSTSIIDLEKINQTVNLSINAPVSRILILLVSGTFLWILDQRLRPMAKKIKS